MYHMARFVSLSSHSEDDSLEALVAAPYPAGGRTSSTPLKVHVYTYVRTYRQHAVSSIHTSYVQGASNGGAQRQVTKVDIHVIIQRVLLCVVFSPTVHPSPSQCD